MSQDVTVIKMIVEVFYLVKVIFLLTFQVDLIELPEGHPVFSSDTDSLQI